NASARRAVLDGPPHAVRVAADLQGYGPRKRHPDMGGEPVVHAPKRMLTIPEAGNRGHGAEGAPRVGAHAHEARHALREGKRLEAVSKLGTCSNRRRADGAVVDHRAGSHAFERPRPARVVDG